MRDLALAANDAAIRAATYAGSGGWTEYAIAGNPGLRLVVYPLRKGEQMSERVWRCRYSLTTAGKRTQRRVRIGRYPAIGLARARAEAAAIMAAVEEGRDPFKERELQTQADVRAALTFRQFFDDYCIARADLVSIDETRREFEKDILPVLGHKAPNAITPAEIDAALDKVLRRGAGAVAYRILTKVKALYNFTLDSPALAELYGVTSNPADRLGRQRRGGAKKYAKSRPKERFLDDDEIVAFLSALREVNQMPPAMKLTLRLILATGQRPGEIRQMQWRHLQLDRADPVWVIPREMTKNRRAAHIVPLSTHACLLINSMRALSGNSAYVLPWARNRGEEDLPAPKVAPGSSMRHLFAHHLSQIMAATPHDLRRTAATGMRRLGVPREVVSKVLNHTDAGITASTYDQHAAVAERRDALMRWGEHLDALFLRACG